MMTEREIDCAVAVLFDAIRNGDEKDGNAQIERLLATFLIDVHRIADALEHMAKPPPS